MKGYNNMIRNKIVAFATAISVMASMCVGVVSASAASDFSVAGETSVINKGYEMVYNEAESTSTEKVVEVYNRGVESVFTTSMFFEVPVGAVTDVKFTAEGGGAPTVVTDHIADGKFSVVITWAAGPYESQDKLIGTLKMTVPEGTDGYDLTMTDESEIYDANVTLVEDAQFGSITVGTKVEPTPEPITKGYEMVYDETASTSTEKVVEVYNRGIDAVFTTSMFFEVPAGSVTDVKFTAEGGGAPTVVTDHIADGKFSVVITWAAGPYESQDKLIGTLKMTVPEGTSDYKLTMTDESEIYDANVTLVEDAQFGSIVVAPSAVPTTAPTVAPTTAPTVAPTTAPTVAPTTAPTVAPYEDVKPTMLPTEEPVVTPEPITKGYEMVYNEDASTSTEKVVEVYNRGIDAVFTTSMFFEVPAGSVTDVKFTAEGGGAPTVVTDHIADGKFSVVITWAAGPYESQDKLIGTLKMTVPEGTSDYDLTMTDESEIYDANVTLVEDAQFGKITIGPKAPAPTQTPAPTDMPIDDSVKVSDLITSAPETDDTYGKLTGIVVEVKKTDGTAATYGTDYVAIYDGKQLTEDEFFNMINGYSETPIADVIKGLSIGAKYETGVTVKASPAYQTNEQAASGKWTVVPGYGNTADIKEETPSTKATLTLTKPTNGTIYAEYVDADNNTVKITDYGKAVEIPTGTKVTYTAVADTGYTFKSWSGITSSSAIAKDIVFSKTITVAATFGKVSSGGSTSGGSTSGGSTSSGSGSGTIAGGTGGVTPGTTPNSGVNFQDLGSVQWAVPAINTLVNLGVINGRSDTIFDPNASVTRAEFTKMVCAAFGIASTPSAAQTFTDVAPTDWFYGYVQAAAAKGIVNGVSDTAFDPNATIKRQEMAAILYRTIQATNALALLPQGTEKAFADAAQIDEYAQIPVSVLSAAGVINGVTDTTFEPYATATRAQAACIIYQYYQAIGAA